MPQDPPWWVEQMVSEHIRTIPPYVPGKPVQELIREAGIEHVIKLASNENALGPSPRALDALAAIADRVHVYPVDSAPDLCEALASRFRVDSRQVIIGNGSDEILLMLAHALIQPGDEVIVGEHTFSMYGICAKSFGGTVRVVAMKDCHFDLSAMADVVTDRTRIVFLALPNNPTGTVLGKSELHHFLDRMSDRRLIVVIDEAYREFVRDPECPTGLDFLGRRPPVMVLRTFSKMYGLAGLRVGYGITESWLNDILHRVRVPFSVNSLAQHAAIAALDDTEHVDRSLRMVEEGLAFLESGLTRLGIHFIPSQANFLTFCVEHNAHRLYEALLRQGIIVRHLASFGLSNCVRVTVGTPSQNQRFMTALQTILAGSDNE